MLTVTLVMTGFAFFLLGIILGNIYSSKKPHKAPPKHMANRMSVSAEYRDFLNYDGSEQA